MPANVEIKASLNDFKKASSTAKQMASYLPGDTFAQTDTFFCVPNGRLKLREFEDRTGQLIFYDRPDETGPKHSKYSISTVPDPRQLQEVLSAALGIRGVVKKMRTLYVVGQTRVHLDRVEGLGDFLEFEVVLREGETVEYGQKIANDMMQEFGILSSDLISGAYLDLILKNSAKKQSKECT